MRTLNGEKYVADPPPEFGLLARDRVLERRRARNGGDRERAVVRADADAADHHDVADRAPVRRVRVDRRRRPGELAPGIAGVAVPPPETGSPVTAFVYWNERVDGTAVTVNVPL